MASGAVFSGGGRYRYALWRDTGRLGAEGTVLFVMLNPSFAGEAQDDPTIRRCIGFAGDWNFARLAVANAYAFKATDPRDLKRADDPIGPANTRWLERLRDDASQIIVAWGTHIDEIENGRQREVLRILEQGGAAPTVRCLGQTKDLFPRHPLYLKADTKRVVFKRRLEPVVA